MKKLNGGTRRRITRRKKREAKPQKSLAIVRTAPEQAAPELARLQNDHTMQVVPSVKETIKRLENVRKFVVGCLNQGLKRAEAKAAKLGTPLTDAERRKLEVDYGTIPGADRPFLKQPGAEKIALWLHVRPEYTKTDVQLPEGHLETLARCRLISVATKDEVFQGPECSCSTMESNFRFRFAEANIAPAREEVARLVFEGRGKWKYTLVLENGRVLYKDGKPVLERKWHNRFDNPNIYDERNKVRQQAEKRALVKTVRNFGALSEIFVEDPTEWEFEPEHIPERSATITEVGKIVRDPAHVPIPEQPKAAAAPEVMDGEPDGKGKTVQLVFLPDTTAAHVSGDIAEITGFIKKQCQGAKLPDVDVYQIPANYVDVLAEQVREWGFSFQEVSRIRTDSKPGCGVITQTKLALKPGTSKTDYYQVLISTESGNSWYFCYNETLIAILAGAKGKDVDLIVNGKTVVGARRIGIREYMEDGLTPKDKKSVA